MIFCYDLLVIDEGNCLRASSVEGHEGDHDRIMDELSNITGRVSLIARTYSTINNGMESCNLSYNEGMSSIENGGSCCYLGSEGAKQRFNHSWRKAMVKTTAS